MSNNNHNSECSFTGEILTYLYEELGKKERKNFEAHLSECTECTDGLADIAFARFSVQEWRGEEFAPLKTPIINIPYETQKARVKDSTVAESWLARMRGYVSVSPAWATMGGAAAAVVVCLGLIFAALNLFQPDELAVAGDNNPVKTSVSPTAGNNALKNQEIYADAKQTNKLPGNSSQTLLPNTGETESAFEPDNQISVQAKTSIPEKQESVRKVRNVKRYSERITASEKTDIRTVNRNAPRNTGQTPVLSNFEEEEDNTLRLAELFEDFDTE